MAEQEFNKVLNLFPEEIWCKIFEEVRDYKTIQNLRNSSPVFASLTESKRTQMLFPGVGQLLFKFLLRSIDAPRLCDTTRQILLNCRMVCRAWKQGVDSFLENPESHLTLPSNAILRSKYPAHLRYFITSLYSNLQLGIGNIKFYDHFTSTHQKLTKNPFLSRNVSISLDSPPINTGFTEHINQILERWGHHIWYAYFRLYNTSRDSSSNGYLLFRHCMSHMPNVKVLDVVVINSDTLEDVATISEKIQAFPHYPHLQSVRISGLHGFVWEKFTKLNSHVLEVSQPTKENMLRKSKKDDLRRKRELEQDSRRMLRRSRPCKGIEPWKAKTIEMFCFNFKYSNCIAESNERKCVVHQTISILEL